VGVRAERGEDEGAAGAGRRMQRRRQERRSAGTGVVEACRLAGTQRVRSSRIGWLKEPPFHPRSQPPTPHPLCTRAMHAFCISHLAIGNAQFLAAASHQPVRVCVCACRSPRPVALVACGQVGAGRLRHGEPEQRSVPDSLLSFGHHPRPWPCCLSPPMAAHGRPWPRIAAPSGPSLVSHLSFPLCWCWCQCSS
jgi:hypothetical protein